jgi:hypothetical protein
MKYFEADKYLQIAPGAKLHLTDAQAAARKHALAPVPEQENVHAAGALVNFKRGEQFGCDQEVGGAHPVDVTEVDFGERIAKERKSAVAIKSQALARRSKATKAAIDAAKRKKEEWDKAAAPKARAVEEARQQSVIAPAETPAGTDAAGLLDKAKAGMKRLFA